MVAILNSWGSKPKKPASFRSNLTFLALLGYCCLAACLGWVGGFDISAQADTASPLAGPAELARHAEKVYLAAKSGYEAQTNNAQAAWQFGKACYDWADFATSNGQREEIAKQGIAVCRALSERDPGSAPGHYYLALNLGQLAQTKKLGALKLVGQMEGEFKTVLGLDPQLDYAGADRGLGLLYLDAPGWPTSIGSKSKARQHLQKALKLAPDFPENQLNLIEAELKWGEKTSAAREMKVLDELWPAAQKKLAGEEWGASWADWTTRREAVRKKLPQPSR